MRGHGGLGRLDDDWSEEEEDIWDDDKEEWRAAEAAAERGVGWLR